MRGRSVSRLVFLKTRSKSRICVRGTSRVRILVDLQGRETQPEPRVKKPVAGACESGSHRQRMEPMSSKTKIIIVVVVSEVLFVIAVLVAIL